jgi:tetratricopeptide (TPR) repeat protein
MYGDDRIICALAAGTSETSFPEALTEGGREPLAADLSRKNFRLGLTQISASLLGVGLDDLVQRDLKKARQRVTAITVSACAAMLVMGSLTWTAMSARQLAEQRRQDAEGQIEFMITDLKDELESVGRLDPLNAVGERAVAYYDGYPLAQHDEDALGRRVSVFHMLGEVQDLQGNLDAANDYFAKAYDASEALLARDPENADRLFEHSQSAYWVGASYYNQQNYPAAEALFQEYGAIIERLATVEGNSARVEQERIYVLINLGAVAKARRDWDAAGVYMAETSRSQLGLLNRNPDNLGTRISAANSLIDLGSLRLENGNIVGAILEFEAAQTVLEAVPLDYNNVTLQQYILTNLRSLTNAYVLHGDLETAEDNLVKCRSVAETLYSVEPNNVDTQFERFHLTLTEFQLAFMQGESERVDRLYATLQSDLYASPDAMKEDFRFESVRRLARSFPLYIAILSEDKNHQAQMARELRASLGTLATSEGRLTVGREDLLPYLLTRAVFLPTDQNEDPPTVCLSTTERLNLFERSALSTLFSAHQCPSAQLGHAHPNTIFRSAFSRLNQSR